MIRRSPRRDRWVVIDNDTIRDKRLSWKARGLLAYLLSMPDNWEVSSRDLANRGPDGRAATMTALRELEAAGYLTRAQYQRDDGTFGQASTVYETPVADNQPPWSDSPTADHPTAENRTLSSTQPSSTQEEETRADAPDPFTAGFDLVWKDYPRKESRKAALRAYQARRRAGVDANDLARAVEHYAAARAGQDPKYTLLGATFFGPNERWRDFLDVPAPVPGDPGFDYRDWETR